MSNHSDLIAQFIEISGSDESTAKFYLSSSNWSLETALSNFLSNQSENVNNLVSGEDTAGTSAGEEARSTTTPSGDFTNNSTKKPKIATLNDVNQHSSNDEEGQAFYAGGSDRSGQQVLGPPKRKNFREELTNMFRLAQNTENIETNPSPSTSGANWGQGMRLGMTDNDHTAVPPSGSNLRREEKPVVVLRLWSQGFTIDEGELRDYEDPKNKEFLDTVMRGEIPPELLEVGWMVNVDVEDHRREDYKKRAVPKSFKGSGHTLGSPAPNIEETTTQTNVPDLKPDNAERDSNAVKEAIEVNREAPLTTVQIRLADGTRLSAQFNLTHTVSDIYTYIVNLRPEYANRNFVLVSSFPTRELLASNNSIEEAGLQNAALMQRLK